MRLCFCVDTVNFFVGALLVVIHSCLCTRRLARNVSLRRVCRACIIIGMDAMLRAKAYLTKRNTSDELTAFDVLAKRKLEQRKIEIARVSFFSIANLLLDHGRFSDGQTICLLCAMALSICAYSAPPSTPCLRDIYYSGMMILCTAYMFASPPDLFFFGVRTAFFIRLVLSVTSLNVAQIVIWNLAALGASGIYTASIPNQSSTNALLLTVDIMATFTFIVVSIGFERWIVSTEHREAQVSLLKINNSSSMLLLDMMCDVVLELSDKLMIASESRRFAALMMKSPLVSLVGQPFAGFIEDELGRQTFENHLIAGTGENGKVGVCNATLRDSERNSIKVEIFYVKVEMDADIYHYLVGLRESNQEPCGIAPSFSAPEPRKCRPSEQNGTPSVSSRTDLIQPCIRKRRRGIKGGLRNPHLRKTESNARCISMENCLSSWNINVQRGVCCAYHAYVLAGKNVFAYLAGAPCRKTFPIFPTEGLQCQTCGTIIGDAEEDEYDTCPACNSLELSPFLQHDADNDDSGVSVEESGDEGSHSLLNL
eukprot:TRINITY_DN24217_c0_g1_i1.p1 TRINITY_DN24217_c0_g1~~TRINITY_DN24217_c0_g1_i1.p1  ORF type:complete len:539 (-),score=61.70 TRINITY_DN24217_c0_g1_i1:211-1827(-)